MGPLTFVRWSRTTTGGSSDVVAVAASGAGSTTCARAPSSSVRHCQSFSKRSGAMIGGVSPGIGFGDGFGDVSPSDEDSALPAAPDADVEKDAQPSELAGSYQFMGTATSCLTGLAPKAERAVFFTLRNASAAGVPSGSTGKATSRTVP